MAVRIGHGPSERVGDGREAALRVVCQIEAVSVRVFDAGKHAVNVEILLASVLERHFERPVGVLRERGFESFQVLVSVAERLEREVPKSSVHVRHPAVFVRYELLVVRMRPVPAQWAVVRDTRTVFDGEFERHHRSGEPHDGIVVREFARGEFDGVGSIIRLFCFVRDLIVTFNYGSLRWKLRRVREKIIVFSLGFFELGILFPISNPSFPIRPKRADGEFLFGFEIPGSFSSEISGFGNENVVPVFGSSVSKIPGFRNEIIVPIHVASRSYEPRVCHEHVFPVFGQLGAEKSDVREGYVTPIVRIRRSDESARYSFGNWSLFCPKASNVADETVRASSSYVSSFFRD